MLQTVCFCFCFSILSLTSCSSKTLDIVNSDNNKRLNVNSVSSDEQLSYLDLNSPSVVQSIDSSDKGIEGYRFVQVEVAEVINPKKHPVTFEVYYQTKADEKLLLGSFALYPSDNPGKFIVATQGKLKNEGAIVLSLVRPDKVDPTDIVKVGVRRIKFVNA